MAKFRTKRERAQAAAQRNARKRRSRMIMTVAGAAVAAVVLLVIAGGAFRGGNDVALSEAAAQREGRVMGSPTAPVIVTMWEDYQCPVCKTANSAVVKRLITDYVETGKVQLHFRNFAFIGQESIWAAEAAEAAAEQGKFWEYHDALFAAQSGENRGAFTKMKLMQMAANIGLDVALFNQAIDSGKYSAAIAAERQEGQELGVSGTPTFFVDGVAVKDWRQYEAIQKLIDSQLAVAQ